MASGDMSKELSLIDTGISNLWTLTFPGHLESLNLHGNEVRHISNLAHLSGLRHLDLSANQIREIDGLEKLINLKTLNLSCNLISVVDGISTLRSLVRLNLSYNQIEDLSGVASLGRSGVCHLRHLALHGNRLRSVRHVVDALCPAQSLRHLILSQDGDGNPLCSAQGYEAILFNGLPQLESLNGTNQSGMLNKDTDSFSHIPGLDAYLDFSLSSDLEQPSQSPNSPPVLITPKIDAVMEKFKQRFTQDTSSSIAVSGSSPLNSSDNGHHTENMRRILSDTDYSSPSSSREMRTQRGKPCNKDGQRSGEESEPVQDSQAPSQSRGRKKVLNVRVKSPSGTRVKTGPKLSNLKDTRDRQVRVTTKTTSLTQRQGTAESTTTGPASGQEGGADRPGREDADLMYKELLSTLETERERRWKAEQATRRLANTLKDLHAKGQAAESMKQSALEATSQLKQAVLNEHEGKLALTDQLKKQQATLDELQSSLSESRRGEERSREALRATEQTLASKEAEAMADRAHQAQKFEESQHRAAALGREVEVLQKTLQHNEGQLRQLQETLAARENQHRDELKHLYRLDGPELQEVIAAKVKAVEGSQQAELLRQRERVEQLSKQYSDLEEEFRYALHSEEKRFKDIKSDLERRKAENADLNHLLLAAQRKDDCSSTMITELTSLVKEQKGRITELAKSKNEQLTAYKERLESQEESLEDARKQLAQMELHKQAKSKLQATVQAQESVIEGLKAERRLWGQELAQQGASLSQDRGRLEAKIESLNAEIARLKKQLEGETDSVKIKTKMLEDQTETIRKLKEAILERDETIKSTREENVTIQRSLEDQIGEYRLSLDETRDFLDRTTSRKDELKQQVVDLQSELQDAKESHSALSAKWKGKSELIGRLEQQVTQMKNSWGQKEVQMAAEKKAALEQAKQALENLKSADAAFRHQLEVKEAVFKDQMAKLEEEKQREIELANRKVAMVEEEMRDLLRENEASKKATENKVKRLTQALGDLQTDLL